MTYETNYLSHHGIKGQKWGVRRFQNSDGTLTAKGKKRYSDVTTIHTKSGESIHIAQRKVSTRKGFENERNFDMFANGKKVGNIILERKGEELYVNWIDVNHKNRGKGYASAAMNYVCEYGKKNGHTYVSLEVPTVSPDARHVYEKTGFRATKNLGGDNDVWGGLTRMEKKL